MAKLMGIFACIANIIPRVISRPKFERIIMRLRILGTKQYTKICLLVLNKTKLPNKPYKK